MLIFGPLLKTTRAVRSQSRRKVKHRRRPRINPLTDPERSLTLYSASEEDLEEKGHNPEPPTMPVAGDILRVPTFALMKHEIF